MGSTVSALKKSLEDPEQEKQANDALNVLAQVAQTRIDTFYQRVNSPQFDPGLVPISKVIYKYQYFQCGVSNNASDVSQAISDSLGAFISGDVQKGVNTIVGSALGYLLGNYSANASSTTIYALTTGELGGLCRIDADFYSYEYTSKSLTSITKNVVVCSLVISSAKLDNLTLNDVTGIVQTLYGGVDIGTQRRIRDQLWEQVQGNNHLLEYRDPLETADLAAIFKGNQDYDPTDLDNAVPQPGLDHSNRHKFLPSTLQLVVTRYQEFAGDLTRRGRGEGKLFAESLKSFLTAWLVAYSRTLPWKAKCPDVNITYTCDPQRDNQVFFDIRVWNVEEDYGRVLDLVQHQAEEGLRYLQEHPTVEPVASKFEAWRFERPVFEQRRRGEPDRFRVKVIQFDRATVNAVLGMLTVDNPLLCGEQMTQLVIDGAEAFNPPSRKVAKMTAFAEAFADNFGNANRQTQPWFNAMYTVLKLTIAGINYFVANGRQLRGDLDQYWPWAEPDKMMDATRMLVDAIMPIPYVLNANLRDNGMVYMIGRLYTDHLLSKENLTAEYPEIYDFIFQYATNANTPDYCRDLAIRLRDGVNV